VVMLGLAGSTAPLPRMVRWRPRAVSVGSPVGFASEMAEAYTHHEGNAAPAGTPPIWRRRSSS
jgi:hypothetical protein